MKILLIVTLENKGYIKLWKNPIIPCIGDKIMIKDCVFKCHGRTISDSLLMIFLTVSLETNEYHLYYLGFEDVK